MGPSVAPHIPYGTTESSRIRSRPACIAFGMEGGRHSESAAARAVVRTAEGSVKHTLGNCEDLGKASIKCIEDHGYNRHDPACKVHFDAYKECRKAHNNEGKRQLKSLFW